jgi:hypothetical protein
MNVIGWTQVNIPERVKRQGRERDAGLNVNLADAKVSPAAPATAYPLWRLACTEYMLVHSHNQNRTSPDSMAQETQSVCGWKSL